VRLESWGTDPSSTRDRRRGEMMMRDEEEGEETSFEVVVRPRLCNMTLL
jgi:hypothetical protein